MLEKEKLNCAVNVIGGERDSEKVKVGFFGPFINQNVRGKKER